MNCPCQSGALYADCCEPFVNRKAKAPTAEKLMRSRFSAYVVGAIDYLVATTLPASRTAHLRDGYQSTHNEIEWLGLEVLSTWRGGELDKVGKVEFCATYLQQGQAAEHHELSRFRKRGGEWFYVDGEVEDRMK